MRIDGEWYLCDDGIVRPILRAEIESGLGTWVPFELLVDTGADRTVISSNVLGILQIAAQEAEDQIGGIGGAADTVEVSTQIRLTRETGQKVKLRGRFAACVDPQLLDMSVLGRDVLDLFAVIVDRPGDTIALVGQQHRYSIST